MSHPSSPDPLSLPDTLQHEDETLATLADRFTAALDAKRTEKIDLAEDLLRDILKVEPRLAEPRMELARLLLDTDRLEPAEAEAREAMAQLDATGPWTTEIDADVLSGIAHALLAEVLRRRADEDDVIFGAPERFQALVDEAREHFEIAAKLDPSDEYASYHAFFLGAQPGNEGAAPSAD